MDDKVWKGTGAKLFGKVTMENSVVIRENAVVNISVEQINITIAVIPAKRY